MRIIKEQEISDLSDKISWAQFQMFPEEWLASPPQPGDDGHERGRDDEQREEEPQQPAIDLVAVQQQANQILNRAREEADATRAQAAQELAMSLSQARQEAEAMRAQAFQDGEAAKKEAFATGFAGGEESGFKKGYEDGYTKGKTTALQEANNGIQMLGKVISELENYRSQILFESKQDIVKMALSVAEKVLHKEIMTDPATVLSVVKNAISKVGFKRKFTVLVNPLDLEVLQASHDEIAASIENLEVMKFKPDPRIEAGGCVVATESGTVDAQVNRQFKEIKDSVMNAMAGDVKE